MRNHKLDKGEIHRYRYFHKRPQAVETVCLLFVCLVLACCGHGERQAESVDTGLSGRIFRADSLISSGDYVHALDTLLDVCHEIDRNKSIADSLAMRTYFLMGKVHSIYDDTEAAMSYYNKALERRGPDSNPEVLMKIYGNLYQAYAASRDFEAASRANDSLLAIEMHPDGMKKFLYDFNLAHLSSQKGEYARSIEYYKKSLEDIDGTVVKDRMKVYPYSEMADTYRKMGLNDSAYINLQRFEQAAGADGEPYVKASALRELMLWSAHNDNPGLAAEYMERYFAFTDSLINIRAFLKTKENIRRYEEQTSSGIISDMSESISKGHRVIVNLCIVLLFLGIIAAFTLWRSSIIRKNNKLLFAKNEELTRIESQYRELLLSTSPTEGSVTDVTDDPVSESEAMKDLLSKIRIMMERDKPFLDPDFSLQALADLAGSNTKYVSQAINDITGHNFRSFINEYRVKEAERRLLDKDTYGNYTIQGIAESVGIKSKSTFVAAFKKVTGLTPSIYIKLSHNK